MKDRFIEIVTPSGRMETFVTYPEHDGPFPAVIIYMDIWGVREELFEIDRRVGTFRFFCLVPVFYCRGGGRREFRDEQNRMISLHALDEGRAACDRARAAAVQSSWSSTTPADPRVLRRASLCVRAESALSVIAWAGGASCAWRETIWSPSSRRRVCAAPPHQRRGRLADLLAARFRGELYCGFAETDPYAPLSMVKQLDDLLRPYRSVSTAIHIGTRHAAFFRRDIFHPRGAAHDWEMIFAMFHGQIPAYKA